MLSRDNVVLIYQSEIKKFNEMVKAQATIAEVQEQQRHVETLGHILQLSPEQIMKDLNE